MESFLLREFQAFLRYNDLPGEGPVNVYLPGLIGGLLVFTLRIPHEEKVMLERFGQEYRDYMNRTRRFLPRFDHWSK